ncbi:MAG: ClpXP protease specificity-enhancing factor [Gammaproteobacteria bacterium]
MTSSRPYLLRAIYEWIVDNGYTPHIVVAAEMDSVQVPRQFVDNGVIVLNVAPSAVRDLELGNDRVSFSARFAGSAQYVSVPMAAIQAIYARENGQGMVLSEHGDDADAADGSSNTEAEPRQTTEPPTPRPSHLKVIK